MCGAYPVPRRRPPAPSSPSALADASDESRKLVDALCARSEPRFACKVAVAALEIAQEQLDALSVISDHTVDISEAQSVATEKKKTTPRPLRWMLMQPALC